MVSRLREIALDDIYDNPAKYGAPSFEEFSKNRDKYMGRDDETLASISNGPTDQRIKSSVSKTVYMIEGYVCDTLEEVERIAREQGIPIKSLDYRVQVVKESSTKDKLVVKIAPREEIQKRNRWE